MPISEDNMHTPGDIWHALTHNDDRLQYRSRNKWVWFLWLVILPAMWYGLWVLAGKLS